jgi:hypothetical protein
MPVYTNSEMMDLFPADLLKLLKGKACFHIRDDEQVLYNQIEKALKTGYKLYEQKKWV